MKRSLLKSLLLVFALLIGMFSFSQDYLTGRIIDNNGSLRKIYYDRTEVLSGGIFRSIYRVMNEHKVPMYTIAVLHDKTNSQFSYTIKSAHETSKPLVVKYDKDKCGLVFTNLGNLDTAFDGGHIYSYLVSFADLTRDYPVVHLIRTNNGDEIDLDPLSKLRIKKHTEIIRPFLKAMQKPEAKKDTFNIHLVHLRDALYKEQAYYTGLTADLKKQIETDFTSTIRDKRYYDSGKKYKGEKKSGKAEGKGFLAEDKNIYDGSFQHGKLVAGNVILRNSSLEYLGQYSAEAYNGPGKLKYTNGTVLLGIFASGVLKEGICLWKEKNGDEYFGDFKNEKRTGYGEFRTPTGSIFYGEFLDGRLVKGYAKEIDQFGYSTFNKIDKGIKIAVDPLVSKDFFDLVAASRQSKIPLE
ncbi:MAG: hypothetical protein JWO06_1958 [Bacteroidota bacterium]|nr:hypothetical protein [Bacteroidota bacterium]